MYKEPTWTQMESRINSRSALRQRNTRLRAFRRIVCRLSVLLATILLMIFLEHAGLVSGVVAGIVIVLALAAICLIVGWVLGHVDPRKAAVLMIKTHGYKNRLSS